MSTSLLEYRALDPHHKSDPTYLGRPISASSEGFAYVLNDTCFLCTTDKLSLHIRRGDVNWSLRGSERVRALKELPQTL